MNVLTVSKLTKKFGSFTAVNDISFCVKKGEILGLLGPNGAGKTTTLQMVLGVLTPTSGAISYFGKDFTKQKKEILEKVNFSSTYTNLPWRLSVEENLHFISYLYAIPNRKQRIKEIITLFHLESIVKKTIDELSAGQITRVNLAKAFINNPEILLLDEPTASLDPETASFVRDFLLQQQKEREMTILITSHNMSEVEELCNRIVFINHGTIVANDTPKALAKTLQISRVSLHIIKGKTQAKLLCKKEGFSFSLEGIVLRVTLPEKKIADFLQKIMKQHITYSEITIEKPTLEDYFLSTVTKKTTEMKGVI